MTCIPLFPCCCENTIDSLSRPPPPLVPKRKCLKRTAFDANAPPFGSQRRIAAETDLRTAPTPTQEQAKRLGTNPRNPLRLWPSPPFPSHREHERFAGRHTYTHTHITTLLSKSVLTHRRSFPYTRTCRCSLLLRVRLVSSSAAAWSRDGLCAWYPAFQGGDLAWSLLAAETRTRAFHTEPADNWEPARVGISSEGRQEYA